VLLGIHLRNGAMFEGFNIERRYVRIQLSVSHWAEEELKTKWLGENLKQQQPLIKLFCYR